MADRLRRICEMATDDELAVIKSMAERVEHLEAEVRRLRAGIADHRALMRTRGVDGRGTPAQAPNERLWALLDQED
jgi:hypothetical protein